jgi:hypothetical protein
MTGGGACIPEEGATVGVIDDATDCTNRYDGEAAEMGTAGEPPMKNLGSEPGGSNGIHSADPVINPEFAGYNRVRIEKCGFDRYNGRAEFPAVNGTLAGVPLTYDAYQLGWGMMVATLKELLSGLNYTTWTWSGGAPTDIVEDTTATLPPLSDAETILFVGHSGAAHGLMHNIDALVEKLAGLGVNPAVDVRALFDANFTGSPENEAAFADDLSTGAPLNGHVFSNHTMGESIAGGAVGGSPYIYDMAAYYSDPNTTLVKQYDNWQAVFDTSCLSVHSGPDAYLCRDRKHVLLNHVSTPFFIREDFTDPNKEHTLGGLGHPVQWGEWQTDPALCNWFGGTPCPPLLTIAEHRERLEAQAQAVWAQLI